MRILLAFSALVSACVPLTSTDFPLQVSGGSQPVLSWQGGPVGHLQVSERVAEADGGVRWVDSVFAIEGPLEGQHRNVIESPYCLGASLPVGAHQYHPSTNTWDAVFEPAMLSPGHTYVINVARYHDLSLDLANLEYAP